MSGNKLNANSSKNGSKDQSFITSHLEERHVALGQIFRAAYMDYISIKERNNLTLTDERLHQIERIIKDK